MRQYLIVLICILVRLQGVGAFHGIKKKTCVSKTNISRLASLTVWPLFWILFPGPTRGHSLRTGVFFIKSLLLLSRFSRVGLCATPETAAHQAPPSLGFSRQEHWSGLPFPSPMHQSWQVKVKSLSCVRLFTTPWTAAYQAPPSMGFSRQEYGSGVPSPSP